MVDQHGPDPKIQRNDSTAIAYGLELPLRCAFAVVSSLTYHHEAATLPIENNQEQPDKNALNPQRRYALRFQ